MQRITLPAILLWITGITFYGCGGTGEKAEKANSNSAHAGHGMEGPPPAYPDSVNAKLIKEDTLKGSPQQMAMGSAGTTHVHVEYHSPGVKGRQIWGGLVAWDKPWVAGAHNATRIRFFKDVEIKGTTVSRGVYALFIIPGKDDWTIILNRNYEQHLTDEYDAKEDLLREQVKPEEHAFTPRLRYSIVPGEGLNASVCMDWENIRLCLPFSAKE